MPRMTQEQVIAYNARHRKILDDHISGVIEAEHEKDLHAQIYDECRRRGWIALHGSMAERTARNLGEPDFIVIGERTVEQIVCAQWHKITHPMVWFIECKTRTGKLSPAQLAMKAHAEKLGHTIHVVRSFEQFLEVIS